MAKKFIPNGDLDFKSMAESFAKTVAGDPTRYKIAPDVVAAMTAAVARFAEALHVARFVAPSTVATAAKEEARGEAERIIRRVAHLLRADPSLDASAKIAVGLGERAKSPKVQRVPNESPRLTFVRAIHEGGGVPEHELTFSSRDYKSKPPGATRLELFVDLIPADVNAHDYLREGRTTRSIYVRSFTRSPIRLSPPMAQTPMRVIYWARWADAAGEVGPFSLPAIGWVEGGMHHLMAPAIGGGRKGIWIEASDDQLAHAATVVVALRTAHAALTDARPATRQIEGPIEAAA